MCKHSKFAANFSLCALRIELNNFAIREGACKQMDENPNAEYVDIKWE